MGKVLAVFKTFAKDESGASLVEYTVLIGIMLVGVVATMLTVGTWVGDRWTSLNSAL